MSSPYIVLPNNTLSNLKELNFKICHLLNIVKSHKSGFYFYYSTHFLSPKRLSVFIKKKNTMHILMGTCQSIFDRIFNLRKKFYNGFYRILLKSATFDQYLTKYRLLVWKNFTLFFFNSLWGLRRDP